MKNNILLSILRILALIVLLVGAWGSLHFVLLAGQNNKSFLLRSLFVIWVLFPFVALLISNIVSHNWPVKTRVITYCLILIITVGSLIAYSGRLSLPGTKPAAVFLIIPFLSLLLIMTLIPLTAFLSRKEKE